HRQRAAQEGRGKREEPRQDLARDPAAWDEAIARAASVYRRLRAPGVRDSEAIAGRRRASAGVEQLATEAGTLPLRHLCYTASGPPGHPAGDVHPRPGWNAVAAPLPRPGIPPHEAGSRDEGRSALITRLVNAVRKARVPFDNSPRHPMLA